MIKFNNNFVAFNKHICRTAVLFLYSFDQGMLNRDWSSESSLNEKRIIPAQYHLSTVVVEMAKENR